MKDIDSYCFIFNILQRDLYLEFKLNQWIEGMIQEKKPAEMSFEEWLSDGKILARLNLAEISSLFSLSCLRLMRTISFNSLEDDGWMDNLCSIEDAKKERVKIEATY